MVTIWLFEKRGFVSVVAYDPDKDKFNETHMKAAKESTDPNGWLLIRARVLADLREVEKIIGHDIMVFEDKGADYSFRALVTRDDFKVYMCQIVDDIDYGAHFKEVAEKNSSQGKERHSAMMTCWSAMARLQPTPPYGGWTTTYKSATSGSSSKGSGDTYKGKSYYDHIFDDGESGDLYDWQPPYTDGKTGSTSKGKSATVSSKGWSSSPKPPATVPDFVPATYWTQVSDFAKSLLGGMVLADMSHDEVESLTDDAYEMYLEASTRHQPDEVLSAVDIEALCGEEVFADITGEAVSNV